MRAAPLPAAALAAAALAALAGPARAANDSVFTDLDLKRCVVTERAPPDSDPDGKPEAYAWRCKGHESWNVFVAEGDLRAGIAFGRGRRFQGDYAFFPKFSVTGPKVEWRGPRKGDRVVPIGAVLRFRWDADGKRGSVLAVARLGESEADTCVFAYVDAVANPDANAIASALVDDRAADAACGGDPQWVGKVSPDLR
ncbi:hypothetical protein [Prosthecomicrobium sp. N25]|uniref:hypothetical protein n=1 Tax=Prosthecomicrobium sp. N25 TaxID=3129254 RepID=UPI003077C189